MKQEDDQNANLEADYLRKIFAEPGLSNAGEEVAPLLDIPAGLTARLNAIADGEDANNSAQTQHNIFSIAKASLPQLPAWKSWATLAAGVVVVIVVVQIHEQRQTIEELKQAQRDLTTAFRYLSEANQAVEARLVDTLGNTMQKTTLVPVVDSVNAIEVPTIERLKNREL